MGRLISKAATSSLAGLFLLSGLAVLLPSCLKEQGDTSLPGERVTFRVAADYDNGPETRTSYSGVEVGGKERIDWHTGDVIRIWSNQCATPSGDKYADYKVTGVSTSGEKSYATVENVGKNGLHWGTPYNGRYNFFSVYPSPAENGDISLNQNIATLSLPQSQQQGAQMDYAYMYAAVLVRSNTASINLSFKPMFTAFQFKVRSEEDASMTITSFSLSTGENKAMAGSCKATISANSSAPSSTAVFSNFTAYSSSSGNNTITVDMGSGVTVTPSSYATITVFALPQDYSQLTASFTTSNGETKSLKLQNADGTWVNFTACHKYNINGLGLPGEWTYTVSDIDDIIRTGEQVLYDYEKDVTVSIRRSRAGSPAEGIPWKAYFTAASDPTAVVGATVQSSWSETPLQDADGNDWLSLSAYSGTGDANNVKVSLAGNELPPTAIDLMVDAQAMTTAMSANNLGTIDLSRMKFNGSAFAYRRTNPANTANCYVINGYGTFYIPLVYGNGVQNGAAANAYVGVAGENCLETFINADGQPITSDFILQDANLTKSGQYEARIVWQDVAPGFQIIRDSDVAFVPADSSELSGVAALNCAYLKFRVRQYQSQISGKGIKPGNAVIALYDKGEDKILWSWHLWFTNEELKCGQAVEYNVDRSPLLLSPIGWTPPISYTISVLQRAQKVVIVDSRDNIAKITFNVYQSNYNQTISQAHYSATTFSFGRKDPHLTVASPTRFRLYSSAYYNLLWNEHFLNWIEYYGDHSNHYRGRDERYKLSIRYPHCPIINTNNQGGSIYQYSHKNTWGFNRVFLGKTIYDPSPTGFRVATHGARIQVYRMSNTLIEVPANGELPFGVRDPVSGFTAYHTSCYLYNAMRSVESYYGGWGITAKNYMGCNEEDSYLIPGMRVVKDAEGYFFSQQSVDAVDKATDILCVVE